MKAKTVLILFVYLILRPALSNCQSSQRSAYYDAFYLEKFASSNHNEIIRTDNTKELLRFYFGNSVDNGASFQLAGNSNPFLGSFIPSTAGGLNENLSSLSNVVSSVGGLDVTNIADGLAKFLVKRAKQELTIAFFEKFDSLIAQPKYVDLQTIFPETYQALTIVGNDIYQYQGYIQTLRESFEKDLSNLTTNLPTIITNHPSLNEGLAAMLQSGCYVASELRDKTHPGDILENYPDEYLDPLNLNWKGAIQTLQLISSSLRDTIGNTDSAYWVNAKQIKLLINDTVAFKIYLGLVYQKSLSFNNNIGIKFDGPASLDKILKAVAAAFAVNYPATCNFISKFGTKANKLTTMLNLYKKPVSDSLAIQQYYNYFTTTIDLLQQCTQITTIPAFKNAISEKIDTSMKNYFEIARSVSDMVLDISKRNYSAAIVNTVHICDILKVNNDPGVQTALFKYGSFMAAMVQAQSSDDVENVIESFALPAGSSRIKRESPFNVSLNGYCGLFVGNEVIKGVDPDKPFAKFNTYGVTAPIGIAISLGKQKWGKHIYVNPLGSLKKFKGHWSQSIFISIVDLGSVAAYRFNNDTTAQVPTIKLKDIFSPGVFWSIGIPQCPISINLGAQIGPNLRTVTTMTNDYSNNTYIRYSLSVCVDIPLLNLYTKST